MKNKITYCFLFFLFLSSTFVFAQDVKDSKAQSKSAEQNSSELGFYPNPVNNGKIYVTSKNNLEKEIMIFDVLGKKVLHVAQYSKEINITSLSPGVYIIKIKEGDYTATRKLIVSMN